MAIPPLTLLQHSPTPLGPSAIPLVLSWAKSLEFIIHGPAYKKEQIFPSNRTRIPRRKNKVKRSIIGLNQYNCSVSDDV